MEIFNTLGAEVESLWRDKNYDEELFPAIAADALKRADIPSKMSAWDIVDWTLKQSELPPQKDPAGRFGDPPITLYVASRFYIDAYIWLNGTTAIHQHAFCGAFQVMMGSSIHSWYDFDVREKINGFMELGDMSLKVCELLKVGDVQPIEAGRQYIHSLFHLDNPSVSLVVRTEKSPLFLPQFSYHKPTLALDPFFEDQTATKKMQTIGALFNSRHPETERLVTELLAEADFQTSYHILGMLFDWVRGDHLGQLFGLADKDERFERFLSIVRKRHGTKADELAAVFEHNVKVNELVGRRSIVTDPEHRFFIALIMNVDDRENVLSLIRQRFPDHDPIDKILDWTFDLAETRVVGMNIPNALGIADFDSFDIEVLEHALRETADINGAIATELPDEKPDVLKTRIDASLEKIRNSPILGPLIGNKEGQNTAAVA